MSYRGRQGQPGRARGGTFGPRGDSYNTSRGGRGAHRGSRGHGHPSDQASSDFKQDNKIPSTEVTKTENEAFNKPTDPSLDSLQLNNDASRPGYGTKGNSVVLFANYFQLSFKTSLPLHKYAISVTASAGQQPPKGKKLARIVQLLLEAIGHNPLLATDYSTTIITGLKLAADRKEYQVKYFVEGSKPDDNSRSYTVLVQHIASFEAQELLDCLSTFTAQSSNLGVKQDVIHALNIILVHGLSQSPNNVSLANKHFPLHGMHTELAWLGPGVDAFRGYFLSVRPATGRILVNAQVQHLAVHAAAPLNVLLAHHGYNNKSNSASVEKLGNKLRGLSVTATHFNPPRNKTVFGLALTTDGKSLTRPPRVKRDGATPDQVEFWIEDKGYVSVEKYFKENYGKVSIAPVINLGSAANPIYCLSSLCIVSPGQPYRARLNPDQTRKMIKFAVRRPYDNANSLVTKGRSFIDAYSGEMLKDFGITLDTDLVPVDGRVLKAPTLQYTNKTKKNREVLNVGPKSGEWYPDPKMHYIQKAALSDWQYVWITVANRNNAFGNLSEVQTSVSKMHRALQNSGFMASNPDAAHVLEITEELDCDADIRAFFQSLARAGGQPKLFLIILPEVSTSIYNAVKKAGDVLYGCHTICVTAEKFKIGQDSFLNNVALKFNLKLGGRNQQMHKDNMSFLDEGKTMIVGLDVTHPAPGEIKAPSVAAIVASTDKHLGQWPADIRIQGERRREMVDDLEDMMKGRLQVWLKHNPKLPEQILIYRDGVSESQYATVLDQELPRIRKACTTLYTAEETKNEIPHVTIIVVGKRHHTRFYPTDISKAHKRTGNIENGTIVDRGITELSLWDFYLTAHTALHGTAKPAHYVVIHDEIFRAYAKTAAAKGLPEDKLAADVVQVLTHNLCYMFGRATKAVSVCPPAYYADIACERARAWLGHVFAEYDGGEGVAGAFSSDVKVHPNLVDTMFYI